MKPFALTCGSISQEHFDRFIEMRTIFEQLPEFDFWQPVSCHVICRGFAENYPVECVDGHFSKGCDHSWLVMERHTRETHGDTDMIIADMYPCGGATPFLVYGYFMLPWPKLYIEDSTVTEKFSETQEFQEQVSIVATAIDTLRKTLQPPGS